VPLEEPAWWYRQGPSLAAAALGPVAALYGWAARQRFVRAEPYRSQLPVICVGNFTAGGTGKTPLALHLCRHLLAIGHQPVMLTRGYGGRLSGPYWVNARTDTSRDVGDEALLLAGAAPTMVARDRRAGAHAIETGPHPVTVIVMDDGLQNPSLAKNLTIAVVDGGRGIGNGRVIPAGPLRAPLAFQLELTDAVVVNERAPGTESRTTAWLRHRFPGPVLQATTVPAQDAGWLRGRNVVAWAGIGAPERFFALLEALGAAVAERVAFRDHQRLDESDARQLMERAARLGATLVTTQKDMARLSGSAGALGELASQSRVLAVDLVIADADTERLATLIDAALMSRQG
jgi:tetraacyldisaccharide 4'-kinase